MEKLVVVLAVAGVGGGGRMERSSGPHLAPQVRGGTRGRQAAVCCVDLRRQCALRRGRESGGNDDGGVAFALALIPEPAGLGLIGLAIMTLKRKRCRQWSPARS